MATKTEVKRNVSPSLHPAVITSIPGYEKYKGYCGDAESAFNVAYRSVEDVIATRKTVQLDQTRTPKAKTLAVADKAEKYVKKFQKTHGACHDRLVAGINHVEKQLSEPLEQQAGSSMVNGEIRAHTKSLSGTARGKIVKTALEKEDKKVLGAILGAPAMLSGLSDEEHAHYTRQYHEKTNPELVERLNVVKQVKQKLEQSADIIMSEFNDAIGLSPAELLSLREGSKAAEDALIVKEFAQVGN